MDSFFLFIITLFYKEIVSFFPFFIFKSAMEFSISVSLCWNLKQWFRLDLGFELADWRTPRPIMFIRLRLDLQNIVCMCTCI